MSSNPSSIAVRQITAGDKAQWLPLWQAYQDFYHVNLGDAVTDTLWQRIVADDEPVECLVAVQGDRIVGFVHFLYHSFTWQIEPRCFVNDLYVDEHQRGAGVGRKLMEAVAQVARNNQVTKIYLNTHKDNGVSQKLYDKLGTQSAFRTYQIDVN